MARLVKMPTAEPDNLDLWGPHSRTELIPTSYSDLHHGLCAPHHTYKKKKLKIK